MLAQFPQAANGVIQIINQKAFSNFKFQTCGLNAMVMEALKQGFNKLCMAELS